ncbi:hypothetical protein LXL04_017244 [Taraxacum kok-saghyz]
MENYLFLASATAKDLMAQTFHVAHSGFLEAHPGLDIVTKFQEQRGILQVLYQFSKLIMFIPTYFLLLSIPYAASITFNFTHIDPQNHYNDINILSDDTSLLTQSN